MNMQMMLFKKIFPTSNSRKAPPALPICRGFARASTVLSTEKTKIKAWYQLSPEAGFMNLPSYDLTPSVTLLV